MVQGDGKARFSGRFALPVAERQILIG